MQHRLGDERRGPDDPSRLSASLDDGPLRSRFSNISALSDARDLASDNARWELRGRESLVSIDSRRGDVLLNEAGQHGYAGGAASSSQTWATAAAWPTTGSVEYAYPAPAVARASVLESFASRTLSWGRRMSSRVPVTPRLITPAARIEEEEECDLSLLRSAAAPGLDASYDAVPEVEVESTVPVFDVTSALGPLDASDADFIKKLQEQEAGGTLTGGLGQGLPSNNDGAFLRVRDSDLLASSSSPISVRRLTRSFTRRRSHVRPLGRDETIREAGQDEANRRGRVVEVIADCDEESPAAAAATAGTDLSNMEGSKMLYGSATRRSWVEGQDGGTGPKSGIRRLFFPRPDWKPFSMRWPYLGILVLLSVALAAAQEVLYQRFGRKPMARFRSPDEVDPWLYFGVKFAPSICAVLYGVLWQFTDFEVRRLEAFHQLSRDGGALAGDSLNVDYVTSYTLLRPLRALRRRHYAVALSSAATNLAVSLVPTCAAASMVLSPGRRERMRDGDSVEKTLLVSAVWSRLLTITLVACAVLGAALVHRLQSRRSGLLADVRGIAGLASMAVASHIIMDFRDMDTATHRDIHRRLERNRYLLRNSSLAPDDDNAPLLPRGTAGGDDGGSGGDMSPSAGLSARSRRSDENLLENPHPLMLRAAGWAPFLVGSLALTAFIPVFLFTGAAVVADQAPWLVTAAAVSLKLSWTAMDTSVRVMEPFYMLSRRHAPPKTLTLDYAAMPFGYMPLRALANGHVLVFAVGLGSVLAELLTILVTGLTLVDGKGFMVRSGGGGGGGGDSGQETVRSFYTSLALSMAILAYMTTTSCIVFARRRHPFLPRQPNTIASVLAYIYQSKMLWDFVGTATMSPAATVRRLEERGRQYGLGWFEGRDGQLHCGVDQEELLGRYRHGLDGRGTKQNEPWNMRWDVF